jgi:hypothetical protein
MATSRKPQRRRSAFSKKGFRQSVFAPPTGEKEGIEGFLLKKTSWLKSQRWVLRYFCVDGNYIRYYQSDEKQPSQLKGVVDLREVTKVSMSDSATGTILVECTGSEIQLRPKDAGGQIALQMGDLAIVGQKWVNTIQEHMPGETNSKRTAHTRRVPPEPLVRALSMKPSKRLLGVSSQAAIAAATEQRKNVTHEGVMMKRSRMNSRWHRRYFVLRSHLLEYYLNELDSTNPSRVKGSIDLAGLQQCEYMESTRELSLCTCHGSLRLRVLSQVDAASWQAALKKAPLQSSSREERTDDGSGDRSLPGGSKQDKQDKPAKRRLSFSRSHKHAKESTPDEEPINFDHSTAILKHGFLLLFGPANKWKKYFFTLRATHLVWYQTQESSDKPEEYTGIVRMQTVHSCIQSEGLSIHLHGPDMVGRLQV